MKIVDLNPNTIIIGDRMREDFGDLNDLMVSISEKGLIQPITIDEGFELLAGGRRLEAVKRLERDTIPCVVREVKDDIDALEIELYENIHRKDMTWVERARLEERIFLLKREQDPNWSVRAQARDEDLAASTISRRLELAGAIEVIPELAECATEDEAWKKLKKVEESLVVEQLLSSASEEAVEKLDDLDDMYRVGNALDALETLDGEQFDFIEVDPPYGIDLVGRKDRNKTNAKTKEYSEVDFDNYSKWLQNTTSNVYRLLKPDTFCVWWYGMTHHADVLAALREAGFGVPDIPCLWYKGNQGQTASPDTTMGSCYEPFFLCRKGSPVLAKPGRPNVFNISPVAPQKKIHPTERPIELMREIISSITFPGSSIFVPFLGSGVTLEAAIAEGSSGIGYDLSKDYKKGFLNRMKKEALLSDMEN